ncbi:MAG: FAD-binding domain-containing protein [Pseudomonadota bacterium]
MTQTTFLPPCDRDSVTWTPTRSAGLARLECFLPNAGRTYARQRNFDRGADDRRHVSALSPWLRHRLILEEEVLHKTISAHSMPSAEKFIQEVFWRGYFKGWLEHRPQVWTRYKSNLIERIDQLSTDASLAQRYDDAICGRTGIACFDHWTTELKSTGYLHNHARMWFASIWIFTLDLPWELGADFFLRHLLDGDPASNTCSWRWVGGLHTKGKTYLARADNIEQFTDGLFNPVGQLAQNATPLEESELEPATRPALTNCSIEAERFGLLITEDDCSPETLSLPCAPVSVFALTAPFARSVLPTSLMVETFSRAAVEDAAKRAAVFFSVDVVRGTREPTADALLDWVHTERLDAIVTPRLCVGPAQRAVMKATQALPAPVINITRSYDRAVWPHATKGFFGLKKKIPSILTSIGIAPSSALGG